MGHSVDRISENFRIKKSKILEYEKQHKLCPECEWDDESSAIVALKVIVEYFKEDIEHHLMEIDVS